MGRGPSFCSFPVWRQAVLQLLCLVGEAFDDYSDDVCGAVVNVRGKGDKIAIWTANYENRDAVTHIGWDVVSLRRTFCFFCFYTRERAVLTLLCPFPGEFTSSAWSFPWRWPLATSLTPTRPQRAARPPRTNMWFKTRPRASSISSSYSSSVHIVYSAESNLEDAAVRDYTPGCSTASPGHQQENRWSWHLPKH